MAKLREDLIAVRTFKSSDGLHEIVIFQRSDGFFGFFGFTMDEPNELSEPTEFSGIYETAEGAEFAALTELKWLRGKISN